MVKYIIPTHVHLDHAGGAGILMEKYPDAELVIHPRGFRHMVDPAKLVAGSKAVYGEKKFNELYGKIVPVATSRIIKMKDRDLLYLKNRVLEFRDTPGHADHHFCIWDQVSRGWFSGDTFGISYEQMGVGSNRFILPTTSPVQFDPDKLLNSIELMMNYNPSQFFLTHFSVIKEPFEKADMLREQIESYRRIAYDFRFSSNRKEKLFNKIKLMTLTSIASRLPHHDIKLMEELLDLDFSLNAQGLDIWIDKQNHINIINTNKNNL
jgi:glyoxylase-like metal-dependent hydrolase (beta-lactamase superfamily II)